MREPIKPRNSHDELKYVDTSALIAFLDKSDSYHPLFAGLFAHETNLVTTPLVISEGQGWFLRRFDSYRALQFIHFIETLSIMKIISIDNEELLSAYKILRKYSDQKLTLTDALGLAYMQKKKISICFSTDRHMSLTGTKLAIHQ